MKSRSPISAKTRPGGSVSGVGRPPTTELGLELVRLLSNLGEGAGGVEPVEPGGGGPALCLTRLQERRERLGDVVEDPLPLLLLALQLLPATLDRARRGQLCVPEDVRVSPHELGVDPARHFGEVAGATLLQQEGEEDRLEQEVAELVGQLRVVTGLHRVGHLVGLLDGVGDDRALRLGAVPGTVAPEPLGELLQIDERPLELGAATHGAIRRWWWCRSRRTSSRAPAAARSPARRRPGPRSAPGAPRPTR